MLPFGIVTGVSTTPSPSHGSQNSESRPSLVHMASEAACSSCSQHLSHLALPSSTPEITHFNNGYLDEGDIQYPNNLPLCCVEIKTDQRGLEIMAYA